MPIPSKEQLLKGMAELVKSLPDEAREVPRPLAFARAKLDEREEWVFQRLQEGASLTQIGRDSVTSVGTVIAWLAENPARSARARAIRKSMSTHWDEKALEGIEGAETPFELDKARHAAFHLRWRSSVTDPDNYATHTKGDMNVNFNVGLAQRLEDARRRAAPLIEGEAEEAE